VKTLALFLLALGLPVAAQQVVVPSFSYPGVTFNLPQPDGTTIVADPVTGLWSCTVKAGLPQGLSFDGTIFKAPNLQSNSINLTGGTNYPDGTYLETLTTVGGVSQIKLTPYVPSSGSGVFGTSIAVPATSITAFSEQSRSYTLSGIPAPGMPAVVYVNPSIDFGSGIRYSYRVTAVNTVVVKLTNVNNATANVPTYTLNISAIK